MKTILLSLLLLTPCAARAGTTPGTANAVLQSSAAFNLNTVYPRSIVSGYAVFSASGSSTYSTLNVSSITFVATGKFRINWAKPMATNYYPCQCTCIDDASGAIGACICSVNENSAVGIVASSAEFIVRDVSNVLRNPNKVYVTCFGGAEAAALK